MAAPSLEGLRPLCAEEAADDLLVVERSPRVAAEPGPHDDAADDTGVFLSRSTVRTAGLLLCIAAAALGCILADNLRATMQRAEGSHGLLRAGVESSIVAAEVAPTEAPMAQPDTPWWEEAPKSVLEHPALTTKAPEQDWFDLLSSGSGADIPLAPRATLNDGNRCEDDEEMYPLNMSSSGALCYKKCLLLTAGEYPIRTSPWTCCQTHPCSVHNQKHDAGFCSGFDVAGSLASGGNDGACPHTPGACLQNEELYLGTCYKKCSIMNPLFPVRMGPGTCCKSHAGVSCLIPGTGTGMTSSDFNVGGGAGDNDDSTPSDPHQPMESLTESA